jgi:hypothetical protein
MDLLQDAIRALGLTFRKVGNRIEIDTPQGRITIQDGKATFTNRSCQQWVNKIKQAYSFKTVERVAKKYKFNLIAKSENQIVLRRY